MEAISFIYKKNSKSAFPPLSFFWALGYRSELLSSDKYLDSYKYFNLNILKMDFPSPITFPHLSTPTYTEM